MRRRTLLASLASASAVLAGCQTRASDGSTTGDPTTDSPTSNGPPETDKPTTDEPADRDADNEFPGEIATTTRLDTQPRTLSLFPVAYESHDGGRVRLAFESGATADQPATIRAELTNENEFSNVFRLGRHPPFQSNPRFTPEMLDRSTSTIDPGLIYLAPLPDQSLPVVAPDVERGPEGVWRLAQSVVPRWLPETHRLDAGESVSVTFAVVGGHDSGGPWETTQYRNEFGVENNALTLAAWNHDHPGPSGDSGFQGESFPPLPGHDGDKSAAEIAWFHEVGSESNVFLEPSAEQTGLPADLTFSLVNHAEEPATGNPYYWSLHKLADDEWQKVAPQAYPLPMGYVAPGDTKEYGLRVAHGDPDDCSESDVGVQEVGPSGPDVGHLGGGTYAFEAGMSVDEKTHAAVFDVDAPPVEIESEDGVDATQEGDSVTVTSPRWDAGHGRGILTITRVDSADHVVLPEVAARRPRFRNTLPFFAAGVTTVDLRTSDGVARFRDDQPQRFEVQGRAYEASVEILEE
jgi:hypothetical protein